AMIAPTMMAAGVDSRGTLKLMMPSRESSPSPQTKDLPKPGPARSVALAVPPCSGAGAEGGAEGVGLCGRAVPDREQGGHRVADGCGRPVGSYRGSNEHGRAWTP